MPYPLRFILSVCLLVTGTGLSRPVLAVSKGYDAPAQVILKDGLPCFFAEMGTLSPTIPSKTLTVVDHRGIMTENWRIEDRYGTEPMPSSIEQCIKYGTPWPTGVTITALKPLQYGVQYYTDIWVGINNGVRFRVKFCLSEDANGKPLLTKWAHDRNLCTNRPLSDGDRPWLLEWLFGRQISEHFVAVHSGQNPCNTFISMPNRLAFNPTEG